MEIKLDRRGFLVAAGASVMAASFPEGSAALAQQARGGAQTVKPELAKVKACVFDTFGTVVDWRGSIIAEATVWGKARGVDVDWGKFADRWRSGYGPSMNKVRTGELPWTKLDALHRMLLEDLLKEYGIT